MTTDSTPAAADTASSSPRAVRAVRALGAVRAWAFAQAGALVRALRDPRLARELVPLALPLALYPWLHYCCHHYEKANVFRDTTTLTYVSWCIMHGERLYDTVSLMDGPLAYITHAAMLLWGGFSEAAWRQLDLYFHVFAGGALGALLAPAAERYRVVRKATWAVVGASLWLTELVAFDFGATLQREAHYVAMGMLGMALVYTSVRHSRRVAAWMIFAGALLSGWTVFGKQTAAVYPALVVLTALLLPSQAAQTRLWRLRWTIVGGGVSVLSMLGFVVAIGSLRGMWFWFFRYGVEYYRFHDIIKFEDILSLGYAHDAFTLAVVVIVGGLAAVATGALPRAAVGFAIAPFIEVASVVMQHKGWRYHFIPADFSAIGFFVLAMAQAWGAEAAEPSRRLARNVAAVALSSFVAWTAVQTVMTSPWMHESEEHESDPAIVDSQAAAKVLAAHTRSEDRVFHFGDDPGVLMFAKRRPATPYIVPWMMDLLRHVPLDGELKITPEQQAKVRALQTMNQQDDCARVLANPPPALVFRDNSVAYGANIQDVFFGMCPAFRPVVEARYHELRSGPFHIFLREDRP
jgi:hypothetical protein